MGFKEILVLLTLGVVMPVFWVLMAYLMSTFFDYLDDRREAKRKAKEVKKAKLG